MRIFLIGYMGAGKSTIGRKLATKLGFEFIDLDDYFESQYRVSVPSFFEKYDEAAFRKIESELLFKVCKFNNVVISTGGGTPCFNQNMNTLLNSGLTIYMKMSVTSLYHRLKNAKRIRPIIKELKDPELSEFIQTQLAQRKEFYEKAHLIIKGEDFNIDSAIQEIKLHPLFK